MSKDMMLARHTHVHGLGNACKHAFAAALQPAVTTWMQLARCVQGYKQFSKHRSSGAQSCCNFMFYSTHVNMQQHAA